MRNRIIPLLLLAASLQLLAACSMNSAPGPAEVLEDYLKTYYQGHHEQAYGYVSSQDKSVKSLSEYLAENQGKASPLAEAFADRMSIELLSINETDMDAMAKVSITLPDLDGMLKSLRKTSPAGLNDQQAAKLLTSKYAAEEVPTKSKKEMYRMVREQGTWRGHFDWQTEILNKAREERIAALLDEARRLRQAGSLQAALDQYAEVLALDSNILVAQQGIADTEREIREYKEKQEYIKNVSLYDVKAKFYATYADNKVPGVEFKLKNNGERLLREVEVTVYFKDAAGKKISEERYHPVLAMKKTYSGDQTLLKQNYIWQMEDGNFYKADSVPSEWQEGSVSAAVTDIKFAE